MPSVKNDPEETVAAMFPVPWLTEASSRSCSANMPISCSMVCRPHLETTRCVSTSAARNACSRRIPNIAPVAPVIPTMIRLMVLSVVHARPRRAWKVGMNLRRDRSLDQSRSYNRPIGAHPTPPPDHAPLRHPACGHCRLRLLECRGRGADVAHQAANTLYLRQSGAHPFGCATGPQT